MKTAGSVVATTACRAWSVAVTFAATFSAAVWKSDQLPLFTIKTRSLLSKSVMPETACRNCCDWPVSDPSLRISRTLFSHWLLVSRRKRL